MLAFLFSLQSPLLVTEIWDVICDLCLFFYSFVALELVTFDSSTCLMFLVRVSASQSTRFSVADFHL